MDYEARVSTIEAQLTMNQKDIDRLYQAVTELRGLMLEGFGRVELEIGDLKKHTDQRIDGLRTHTDQRIDGLRAHTDQRIDELRAHVDLSISELRQHTDRRFEEIHVQLRWLMGMWLTTIGLIAGLGGRILGLY